MASFKRVFLTSKECCPNNWELNYRVMQTDLQELRVADPRWHEHIRNNLAEKMLCLNRAAIFIGTLWDKSKTSLSCCSASNNSFEHLPSQMGVKFLNTLLETLRSEQNVSKFQTELKCYLEASACYSVGEFIGHLTTVGGESLREWWMWMVYCSEFACVSDRYSCK
jgi:hypothetical protein